MDHADLVAEMHTVENLPTQDRLHLARMRRAQQLKVARQKEKEWQKMQNRRDKLNHHHSHNHHNQQQHSKKNQRHISFENSVVLLEAAGRNDIDEVAQLLKRGMTPDASNEDGLTALHQCCIDNNIEMLKLLLDYGANVDAQDSDKWTPLHAAATCGHLNLVKILINHGANLLAVNTDGNMPYDLCDDEETLDYIEAEMSKRGVTQELIDETRALTERQMLNDLMEIASNGGDLEEPDHQGATPLHIAAANGYTSIVEFLLEHHVNVDAVDKDLWSPVHAAACWGHLEVLEMLAQYGANLDAKNKDDETPSDICEDSEIRERIEQLRSEQESKRLAEAQRRRVRRSQSNNTRAQSVRRTSLRDKTLTTKKDAVEETRLRLQAQEVFIGPETTANKTESKSFIGNDAELSSSNCGNFEQNKSSTSVPNNNASSINVGISTTAVPTATSSSTATTATSNASSEPNIEHNVNSNRRGSSTSGTACGEITTSSTTTTITTPTTVVAHKNFGIESMKRNQKHISSGSDEQEYGCVNGNITNNHHHSHSQHNNFNNNTNGSSSSVAQQNNNTLPSYGSFNAMNIMNNSSSNNNFNSNNSSGTVTNLSEPRNDDDGSSDHQKLALCHYDDPQNKTKSLTATTLNSTRKPPEGKDSEDFSIWKDNNKKSSTSNGFPSSFSSLGKFSLGESSGSDLYSTNNTDSAAKINVQVTVLVDTHNLDNGLSGTTLASLKKQRSLSRSSAITENGSVITATSHHCIPQSSSTGGGQSIELSLGRPSSSLSNESSSQIQQQQQKQQQQQSQQHPHTNDYIRSSSSQQTIPSPIDLSSSNNINQHQQQPVIRNKFCGITSDVVSDNTTSRKCCLLM